MPILCQILLDAMAGVETGLRPLPIESDLLGHEGLHIAELLVRREAPVYLASSRGSSLIPKLMYSWRTNGQAFSLQRRMLPAISAVIQLGVFRRVVLPPSMFTQGRDGSSDFAIW